MVDKNTTTSASTKVPKPTHRSDTSHPTAQSNIVSDGIATTPATKLKGDSTTGSGSESKTKGKDEERHAHIDELSNMDKESYPPIEAGEVTLFFWKDENKKDKKK